MATKDRVLHGRRGFIGLHVVPLLLEQGYRVRIFDSMLRGDRDAVDELAAERRCRAHRPGRSVRRGRPPGDAGVSTSSTSQRCRSTSASRRPVRVDRHQPGRRPTTCSRRRPTTHVQRLVFASSASVYGDPERLPMHEDGPARPADAVLHLKRAGEDCSASTSARQTGLSWIALRFFNVYGPGQKTTAYYTSVINHFVKRIRNGEAPVIDGRGEQSMDFIHVRDIARSVVLALSGAGQPRHQHRHWRDTSMAKLARILIDAIGIDVEPIFNPRAVLVSRRAADITRAHDVLGWMPEIADRRAGGTRQEWSVTGERRGLPKPVQRTRLDRGRPADRRRNSGSAPSP